MAVTVRIPTTLRPLSGGKSEVTVEPGSLAVVLEQLETAHPGFNERLFDDEGGLRRFVNVFVADVNLAADRAKNAELTATMSAKLETLFKAEIGRDDGSEMPEVGKIAWAIDRADL